MAYVKDPNVTDGGNITTVTGPSSFDYSAGDMLLFVVYKDSAAGGAWATPSGYTQLFNSQSGNISTACFYKTATGSESAPSTSTSDSARDAGGYFHVISGSGTLTIDSSSLKTEGSSTAVYTPNSVSTTATNTLLLFYQFNDTSGTLRSATTPAILTDLPSVYPGQNVESCAGWTFQEASGTSINPDFELMGVETGQMYTIAIADSGTAVKPPRHSKEPTQIIHPLRGTQTAGPYGGGNVDISPLTIDGLTYYHRTLTQVGQHYNGVDPVAWPTAQSSSSAIGIWGTCWNLSAGSVDLSGKDISINLIHTLNTYAGMAPLDSNGMIFGLRSGSGNFRFWNVASIDSLPAANRFQTVVLEVDSTAFRLEDQGTFNSSAVDGIVMGSHKVTNVRSEPSFHELRIIDDVEMVGGESTLPMTFQSLIDSISASSILTISNQAGSSSKQFYSLQSITFGNGSSDLYFADPNTTIEFAAGADTTTKKIQNQSSTDRGIDVNLTAASILDLSNIVISGEDGWFLTINGSSSASATISLSGCVCISPTEITLQDVFTSAGGWAVTEGPEITHNDADLSGGNTFRACADNQYFTITSEAQFENLHNNTFENNSVNAIRITGNQTGSWDDPNLTLSGNTKDIEYTGTTDFSIQSANTITVNNSSSGTLTIVTPVETLSINSDTASTLIRYFENDSQAVVDSTTGTTLDYDYPDTDLIDVELVKQGYVPFNRQDVTPFNGDFDVIMDLDEAYNSAHGLTITTEYDYLRATKVLTINSDQSALDVRSSLADVIRTNSSYYNTALLMDAIPGLTRVDLTDGMTITSMATWKGAGMERFDAADSVNPVEKWLAIKSVGDITGGTVRYRQTDSGSTTGLTLTNNVIDEAFQYYSDPNHDGSTADGYDYSGYMVAKSFLLGSKQGRVDVLANAGISSLSSNLYTVPLSNLDHDYSGTDPGISADITLVAGGVVGGKTFAYEIVDGGTNTGVNIADQINYNGATTPDGVIPGGTGLTWFELGDMVIHNATSVETERCLEEGTTPAYVGFYVSRASSDHPDFTRFQADDGTYYVPAVFNQASITNLPNAGANIMLQIYNVTTATEVYAADPGGTAYSDTYTEGTDYTAGDDVRIRFAELNGSTSFKSFQTNVTASSTGWSLNAANFIESDSTYATNAVDGSTITKFSYTPVNDQFNLLVGQNFTAAELFGFYCATLTTAAGIEGAYGAFVSPDPGNYKNVVSIASIYLDNETTTSQRQTDSARIYRDDGTYPVLVPTTSGYGIDVNWQNVVYVVSTGGSALTAQENAWLSNASSTSTTIDGKIGTPVVDLATDISNIGGGSAPTAVEIRQEIDANSTKLDVAVGTRMSEASINTTAGAIDNVVLVNTTTTNTDMRGTDSANTIAPDNSGITQIQADIAALNDFDPNTAIIEGSETWLQAMRLIRADAAGSIADDDAGNYVIKSADGLKDRITGTYADSSRTITGTDVT